MSNCFRFIFKVENLHYTFCNKSYYLGQLKHLWNPIVIVNNIHEMNYRYVIVNFSL